MIDRSEQTGSRPSPRRHNTPRVLAGIGGTLLVLFLAFLLFDNYRARTRQERQAIEISAEHNRYVASQLSYFFSERKYDLHTLANSREVSSYYENRALGMSLEYGLRLSLADIATSLDRILKEKSFNGEAIYSGITFLDESGTPLMERVRRGVRPDVRQIPERHQLLDVTAPTVTAGSPEADDITVIAPIFFKNRLSGHLVAMLNHPCLASLIRRGSDGGREFNAIVYHGVSLASNDTANGASRVRALLKSVPDLQEGSGGSTDGAGSETLPRHGGQAIHDGQIAVSAPIDGTPFSVLQSARLSDILAGARPWMVLLIMGTLAAMILVAGMVIFRMTARNLVLRTRIDEQRLQQKALEQKNLDLAKEIAIRRNVEKQLRTAKNAAESANRAKSEFLANMSHEIRTPLNAVIGLTDLTLSGDLKPEQRSNLEIVVNSGQSLLNLINDILDFSKIEAGKLELAVNEFGIRSLVDITAETFRASLRGKDLEIVTTIPDDLDDIWYGDVGRIRQVLVNLVGNAVKFTSRGQVEIAVDRVAYQGTKERLNFTITDTGIGIPAEKLTTIFNAFEQADGSTTRRYGGTGLGLSIARKLAGLMNGGIEVSSWVGEGSRFTFHIEDGRTSMRGAA